MSWLSRDLRLGMGEDKGSGEQSRKEGRSSRGQRCRGTSISLARVGYGRHAGMKDEAGNITRDQSLRGFRCLSKEGSLYPECTGEFQKGFQAGSKHDQFCFLERHPGSALETHQSTK